MKIGIFETEHYEGAYPVIRLFDNAVNEVVIFTDPPTHKRFTDLFGQTASRYQWIILQRSGSRLSFFRKLYTQVKKSKPDILYINTISANHILFAVVIKLLSPLRVVITVHDINCLFQSAPSWNIRAMAHHIGKRLLIRWVRELNVVADTMVPYLAQQTQGQKIIHNIPGAIFDGHRQPPAITDHIHLVIPGSIDKKRRDYTMLWPLLEEAERRQLPLYLTILGGHADDYGKTVIEQARSFKPVYTKLQFYDTDVVDQAEFDRQLDEAHFIFIPSVVNTAICYNIPEVYGLTKSSGNIFDVIKHARPFIIPATLQIPHNLQTSAVAYKNMPDILAFLEKILREPAHYQHLLQQAILNSGEYTIPKVRARNVSLFVK
jgi:hypothetical protein